MSLNGRWQTVRARDVGQVLQDGMVERVDIENYVSILFEISSSEYPFFSNYQVVKWMLCEYSLMLQRLSLSPFGREQG